MEVKKLSYIVAYLALEVEDIPSMVLNMKEEVGNKILIRDPGAKYVSKIFMNAFIDLLSFDHD